MNYYLSIVVLGTCLSKCKELYPNVELLSQLI